MGRFVRLELSLFEEIADVTGTPDDTLTGFAMTLLGGAKGGGKPEKKGPTESQGARYPAADWDGNPVSGTVSDATTAAGITYETPYAAVYAADASSTEGETVDSYLKLVIQEVSGLEPQYAEDGAETPGVNDNADFITGLAWDGSKWVDTNTGDGIGISTRTLPTASSLGPS